MADDLILFPFGGNSREAAVAVEALNAVAPRYRILGFLDDNHAALRSSSYPLLGGSELWASYRGKARLLAVSGAKRLPVLAQMTAFLQSRTPCARI